MQAGALQAPGEQPRSLLASLVGIVVESDIDATAGLVTKLRPLRGCQMCADGTGGVAPASLPEHGQIKQAFHQDHVGEGADRFPGKQATLGTRQQAMGESRAHAAAIEIHHAPLLAAGEDDAPAKGVPALLVDQTRPAQQIEGIATIG